MEATDQIDRLIESRAKGREEANAIAALWRASERAHAARKREENRSAWIHYFEHLAHGCRRRAEEYDARVALLLEEGEA